MKRLKKLSSVILAGAILLGGSSIMSDTDNVAHASCNHVTRGYTKSIQRRDYKGNPLPVFDIYVYCDKCGTPLYWIDEVWK